jgi:thiamine-monophosphate kinase
MEESSLLEHICRAGKLDAARVIIGPGDDCACVRVGERLLLTVDHLIESRHFVPGTAINLIARKAVARSVSDIAAMGGTPSWSLATGALASDVPQERARDLIDRVHHWARHWGCPCVGGDLATLAPGSPMVLTVTVGGEPEPQRGPVTRDGARMGDEVYVTGRIGGSFASGRHLTFEPRVEQGRALVKTLGAGLHAMIDVSDGLGRDAGRIARASGVRVEIDAEKVPTHADAGGTWFADGEDYELVFVVASGTSVPSEIAGVALTRIGRVVAGEGCGLIEPGGVREIAHSGWDHA